MHPSIDPPSTHDPRQSCVGRSTAAPVPASWRNPTWMRPLCHPGRSRARSDLRSGGTSAQSQPTPNRWDERDL